MTAFDEALAAIGAAARPLSSERVALGDALGRVLAADVEADEDLVPFARSAMDGFAVRAADTSAGTHLRVAARAYAAVGSARHERGTATAIATGASLPEGTDAVIPIEDVTLDGEIVALHAGARPGDHVFPAGEDARRGDVLLARGTRLRPGAIGLLAAAGVASPPVVRRPRVRVLCTGDELVAVDATPRLGQIRNSNGPYLAAVLAAEGADVVDVRTVADERAQIGDALRDAFDVDMLVTTGGASAGERDFVKAVLSEAGVVFGFTSVAMRPARPTGFGTRGATLVFVLPGNPAAVTAAVHLFVRPALRRLAGDAHPDPARVRARLDGSLRGRPNRVFFAFATVMAGSDGLVARPLGNQCSALTRLGAEANALIVVGPGTPALGPGAPVEVVLLGAPRSTDALLR